MIGRCPELIAALPWVAPFITLAWMGRPRPRLRDSAPTSGRLVSVIIPARNESTTIGTVLRSVLATAYEPVEVLVVDDRSTDDTAAQVGRIAAADPRVRLIHGAELPAGWYGKPWACHQGYRSARGGLLLFTDADTRHEPGLLGHAVGALLDEAAALVTVLPLQRCVTFWERVVMPQMWYLLGLRYQPHRVNAATRARDVIANGQFILVDREAYEAVGTHQAVRGDVAEDLALAQAFVRAGRKLYFAHARELMQTRMYQSLPQLVEGWSKNVYLGGRQTFPDEPIGRALVPLMLIGAMLFWLVPPAVLIAAAAAGNAALAGAAGAAGAAGSAVALSALFWAAISFGMGIPMWYGVAYPLGAVVGLYIFLRSIWRGSRRVEWRGRRYAVSSTNSPASISK